MSQGVGLASCLPKTAWPPTYTDVAVEAIIAVEITVVVITAVAMDSITAQWDVALDLIIVAVAVVVLVVTTTTHYFYYYC